MHQEQLFLFRVNGVVWRWTGDPEKARVLLSDLDAQYCEIRTEAEFGLTTYHVAVGSGKAWEEGTP